MKVFDLAQKDTQSSPSNENEEEEYEYIYEYVEEPRDFRFLHFLSFCVLIIFLVLFFNDQGFKEKVILNWIYIHDNLDLTITFYLFVFIPIIIYLTYGIAKILKWFWEDISIEHVRILFAIVKYNFSIWGLIVFPICLIFNLDVFNIFLLIGSFIALFLMNYYYISYDKLIKDEKEKSKGKYSKPIFTKYHAIILMALSIFLAFYLANSDLKIAVDTEFDTFFISMGFKVIFWLWVILTGLWFMIEQFSLIIRSKYKSHKGRVNGFLSFIWFIGVAYFVAYIVIFNLPYFVDEAQLPYISLGVSFGSKFLSFYGKKLFENPKFRGLFHSSVKGEGK